MSKLASMSPTIGFFCLLGWLIWAPKTLAQATGEAPHILLVYASGGWDPTMVFDNKLDSPYVEGETGIIPSTGANNIPFLHHASRPAVNTWFQNYGYNAVIVNGIYSPSLERQSAFAGMFTAIPSGKNRPVDFLTYYAASLRPTSLAPHIVFDAPYAPGDYEQVAVKLSRTHLNEYLNGTENGPTLTESHETALFDYHKVVWGKFLDTIHPNSLDSSKVRSIYANILREKNLKKALKGAALKLGSQGSESQLLRSGKLALEMFANGSSLCATIQAGRTRYWDTSHAHISRQNAGFQNLFGDLAKIINHAATLGLQNKLLIIVASEMGKSPRFNDRQGKDPWPYTSVLLWGGLLNGGTVHGRTDRYLRGVKIDPVFGTQTSDTMIQPRLANIFSAIYLAAGVPYKLILPEYKPISSILSSLSSGATLQ